MILNSIPVIIINQLSRVEEMTVLPALALGRKQYDNISYPWEIHCHYMSERVVNATEIFHGAFFHTKQRVM